MGLGFTAAFGQFTNTATFSTGRYRTIGLGVGLSLGASGELSIHRSLADLAGSENRSVHHVQQDSLVEQLIATSTERPPDEVDRLVLAEQVQPEP